MSLVPDFQPSRALSTALADELPNTRRARVLYLASSLANDALAAELRRRGASVTQLPAYRTATEPLDSMTLEEVMRADAVTFTSASTARAMAEALGSNVLPGDVRLVSIGPMTSAAVTEFFGRLDGEAAEPTLEDMVKALESALPGVSQWA
jgi:uroporphyrinogen III methyltransferase/synthase